MEPAGLFDGISSASSSDESNDEQVNTLNRESVKNVSRKRIGRKQKTIANKIIKQKVKSKKALEREKIVQRKNEMKQRGKEVAEHTKDLFEYDHDVMKQNLKDSKKKLLQEILNRKNKLKRKNPIVKSEVHLPVSRAVAHPMMNGKAKLLQQLKTNALQKGADDIAKMFGYANHNEQYEHLNRKRNKKQEPVDEEEALSEAIVAEREMLMQSDVGNDANVVQGTLEERSENVIPDTLEAFITAEKKIAEVDTVQVDTVQVDTAQVDIVETHTVETDTIKAKTIKADTVEVDNQEEMVSDDEKNGTGKIRNVIDSDSEHEVVQESAEKEDEKTVNKDRAAAYRAMLLQEEAKNTKSKKKTSGGFVDAEAEEEEEDNTNKIAGLGDFGFGVPKNKAMQDKLDVEEDDNASVHSQDLEGIVDDLSEDEKEEQEDVVEQRRLEEEQRDKEHVSEVMRNVRDGFGRNRKVFSAIGEARGKFTMDQLVAADGSKAEAKRLGLLESDEDSDVEKDGEKEEEEDEEAKMERMMRQRAMNEPELYLSSDEEEIEEEIEETLPTGEDGDSDEDAAIERQQVKMFSAQAKINRRLKVLVFHYLNHNFHLSDYMPFVQPKQRNFRPNNF